MHPSNRKAVAVRSGDCELHCSLPHAVKVPQGSRRDMGHHRSGTKAKQSGQQPLLPRGWRPRHSEDARLDGLERAYFDEMAKLVDRGTQSEHLSTMDEAELRSGPLGDGPVQMTDHRHGEPDGV